MLVDNIRDLRAHNLLDELPKQQSVKSCRISPYRVACNEHEKELYDIAVEAVI